MKIERSVRRRYLVIGGVSATLVVALVGGVALAGVPGSSGVIAACYSESSRFVRIVDDEAGQSCRGDEKALAWNQKGEKGAQGDPGPQGPPGDTLVGYRAIKGAPETVV